MSLDFNIYDLSNVLRSFWFVRIELGESNLCLLVKMSLLLRDEDLSWQLQKRDDSDCDDDSDNCSSSKKSKTRTLPTSTTSQTVGGPLLRLISPSTDT